MAVMLFSLLPYAKAQDDLESKNLRTYEVTYEGHTFEVKAAMTNNGTINGIQVNPEVGSILLTLDAGSQSGENDLTIILPRGLIDSKEADADSEFLVIVDSEDVEYKEILTTETERVLKFPLPEDSSEVEIFGSQVVPEFAFLIVTIASSGIMGAVLVFHRTRRVTFSF